MGYKTYKYRLYPTKAQERCLLHQLNVTRYLYNMLLDIKKHAYEHESKTLSKFDLYKYVSLYRKTVPAGKDICGKTGRAVVDDLIAAYDSFFRRVKEGTEKPGFPKYRSYKFHNSIGFSEYEGVKVDGRRLRLYGVGRVRVRWHRPYEGDIKTVRVVRQAGRWYVSLMCKVEASKPWPATGRAIGLDMGINALITGSDGGSVDNPRWYRAGQADLARKQRKLARAVKGSQGRKDRVMIVARQHDRVKNQRKDFFDKLVYELVCNYDLIAIEDLKIKNMVKNKHLSKSILDAGWGYFKKRLLDKALETGREVVLVNPAYTSKTCSNCGSVFEGLTLSQRWVDCDCGLSLDRDHNAAINVLIRAGHALEPERSGLPQAWL